MLFAANLFMKCYINFISISHNFYVSIIKKLFNKIDLLKRVFLFVSKYENFKSWSENCKIFQGLLDLNYSTTPETWSGYFWVN